MLDTIKYDSEKKEEWEELISVSKNGTCMHSRSYMDYHSDRFDDASLMIYDNSECVGLLPANFENSDTVTSHSGLTYGGLIVKADTFSKYTLKYFSAILKYLNKQGIKTLNMKLIPDYYQLISQQEIEYGLSLTNAEIYKMDLLCTIDLKSEIEIPMQKVRQWGVNKAQKNGVRIKECTDFHEFWNQVLAPNLLDNFGVKPTHSLDEIQYLYDNNQDFIRQFNAYKGNEIIAGTTIFETRTTAHTQYISTTQKGRNLRVMDYLITFLIKEVFSDKKYFSFGRVNEATDYSLNVGLLDWKESFGARGFVQRYYTVETANYPLLDQIF